MALLYSIHFQHILFVVTHCEWKDWTIGKCTKTCGGGTRINTRTEKVLATNGGTLCGGPAFIEEGCNIQECPGYKKYHFALVQIG